MQTVFEFRHPSWFDEEIYTCLRHHKAALDSAKSADIVKQRAMTTKFGCLRLRPEDYTETNLTNWSEFIKKQENHWQEAFIYFKHETAGVGLRFASQMMNLLDHSSVSELKATKCFCLFVVFFDTTRL